MSQLATPQGRDADGQGTTPTITAPSFSIPGKHPLPPPSLVAYHSLIPFLPPCPLFSSPSLPAHYSLPHPSLPTNLSPIPPYLHSLPHPTLPTTPSPPSLPTTPYPFPPPLPPCLLPFSSIAHHPLPPLHYLLPPLLPPPLFPTTLSLSLFF